MKNNFFTSLFILLSVLSLISCQKHVPKIQVYIESLCPDCMYFINRSFKDFVEQVSKPNLADIEFIPFGNAEEKYNEETGKWEFKCQHKEKECLGNLIETCIIQKFGKVNSYKKLICIESNIEKFGIDFKSTMEYCLNNDQDQINEINECIDSDMGNIYQHQMAQKTGEHTHVPWIIVDGVHDSDVELQIIESLKDYLCGNDRSKCYAE